MTNLDMHDAIDRLDSGLPGQPALGAIVAGGRKRRRRTRTVWAAAGLATVAGVAQVAFLAGTHQAVSDGGGGAASASAAASGSHADFDAQVDALVAAAAPDVTLTDRRPLRYERTYEVDGAPQLAVNVDHLQGGFASEEKCKDGCTRTQVGEFTVQVRDARSWEETDKGTTHVMTSVTVWLADLAAASTLPWSVNVWSDGEGADLAEAESKVTSTDSLRDLALQVAQLEADATQ